MKKILRILLKFLKVTGFSVGGILLVLFLAPIVFPGAIADKVKGYANQHLDGELNFSKTRLSFFKHFPSLTVTLYDFSLKGSAPFRKDTLLSAGEVGFGIDVPGLIFDKKVTVNKIFIEDALMNVKVNAQGEANYNVYISQPKKPAATDIADTASANVKLDKIKVKNCHLIYNDQSVQLLADAKGFNYLGNGNLSQAIFDLKSHAEIDSLDFNFGGAAYLKNKRIDADLITKINTNSLEFFFQKNRLVVNELPVEFNGKLDFLKNGYDMDFSVTSLKSKLKDFVTALPPQFVNWLQYTSVKGETDFNFQLKGKYISSSNTMPDMQLGMKIRNGYVEYEGAPFPANDLRLNLNVQMPAMNPDSLSVQLDSLYFKIDKDFVNGHFKLKGTKNPWIKTGIEAQMDLEHLSKAFGFKDFSLQGKCVLNAKAEGTYQSGPNPKSRQQENIVLSIPAYELSSSISNGYFKYASLPLAVQQVNFNLNSHCKDADYHHAYVEIKDLSATALHNFIKGKLGIDLRDGITVHSNLQANLNLSDLKNIYPVKGYDLTGLMSLKIKADGKLDKEKNIFPQINAAVNLIDGSIRTPYYPNPVDKIQLAANITDSTGNLKGLTLNIQPASFLFEGKPFFLQALLSDFENINYDVKAKGELDLAKIYQVFSRKGLDIKGYIKADLSLQGRQKDALAHHYNNLHNEGTLELRDIVTRSDNFPQPFIIKEGQFSFKQDKMWFRHFLAGYGQSDFSMDGYMQHVIDYALTDKGILQGTFNVHSNYINADQFMAFAPTVNDSTSHKINNKPDTSTHSDYGVIIIPSNLDLQLNADALKVDYSNMHLQSAKSTVKISQGKLSLHETGFKLIGADVNMDALYGNTGPTKGYFNYHIQSKEFDIKKAYNEIQLFREMATSAGKAEGIVSLDYTIKGKLDGNMKPIFPSLEGGGTLSVKKVKLMGLKLMSAISKTTGKDSIQNPDMSKIDIKTTIKNNILHVERFKIKMFGFRLRIEGATSLDGKLSLKMRLGLPPLGIIGIPLHVTGTQEHPKVKLGKGKNDELKEEEYKDEEP